MSAHCACAYRTSEAISTTMRAPRRTRLNTATCPVHGTEQVYEQGCRCDWRQHWGRWDRYAPHRDCPIAEHTAVLR